MNLQLNTGWSCPKCQAVMSPTYPTCFYCSPNTKCQHEWAASNPLGNNTYLAICMKCGKEGEEK